MLQFAHVGGGVRYSSISSVYLVFLDLLLTIIHVSSYLLFWLFTFLIAFCLHMICQSPKICKREISEESGNVERKFFATY